MNASIRQQFPALSRLHNDKPLVFLDGPAGTQVPSAVIDRINQYYRKFNANSHGFFLTAQETDAILDQTRANMATFLGAAGPHTISFGQNMTTLNFALARAMGRYLQPGDEILITQLDHEANRGPWLSLRQQGIIVREIRLLPEGTLDYEDFANKLNERTRLVAMGYASNILGTINDVALARKMTYEVGAWLLIDAVHYAPHLPIDVQAIGCDFLLCSAYKFYGPHIGVLYSRPGLLDQLPTDRLRTAPQAAPYSIETGTLNHAAIAGVDAAVAYIADLGAGTTLREKLVSAMHRIHQHEFALAQQLYDGLQNIEGISVYGPPMTEGHRAPTLSFTVAGKTAAEVCQALAAANIFAWDGHFYALRAVEVMGLLEGGGVTRMGMALYTDSEEISYTLKVLEHIARK